MKEDVLSVSFWEAATSGCVINTDVSLTRFAYDKQHCTCSVLPAEIVNDNGRYHSLGSGLGRSFPRASSPLVLAKHTKSFNLIDTLSVGVDRIQRNFEPLQHQVKLWRKAQITDATAKLIDLMRTLIG